MEQSMRTVEAGLSGAVLLVMMASNSALADVPMTGTFTATRTCPAYQSFRKATNPVMLKSSRTRPTP